MWTLANTRTDLDDFLRPRLIPISWMQNSVIKKVDNKVFRLLQNLTEGVTDFNQFMRLTNQLVNAAENFAREEKLSPVVIPTMSKDMVEQLTPAHKVVDTVDRANRKKCLTAAIQHG